MTDIEAAFATVREARCPECGTWHLEDPAVESALTLIEQTFQAAVVERDKARVRLAETTAQVEEWKGHAVAYSEALEGTKAALRETTEERDKKQATVMLERTERARLEKQWYEQRDRLEEARKALRESRMSHTAAGRCACGANHSHESTIADPRGQEA